MSSSADSKRGADDDDQDERIMELEEMDRFDDYGEVADSKSASLGRRMSNHLAPGMELDLGGCGEKGGEKKKANTGAQEDSILVIFELPDGSQGESTFKLGQTVEVLKSFVESEYRIPMSQQTLFLEDKFMMDPLSLMDYPEAKGQSEIYVRVDGPLPSDSKK